jgi:hypothetical protein
MIIILNSGYLEQLDGINGVFLTSINTDGWSILPGGFWDDGGSWDDTEFWLDSYDGFTIIFQETSVTGTYDSGDINIFEGDTIDLSFVLKNYNYQWYFNDTIIDGENNNFITFDTFTLENYGDYKISLTNTETGKVYFFGPISISL